jgi:hypothetical protein
MENHIIATDRGRIVRALRYLTAGNQYRDPVYLKALLHTVVSPLVVVFATISSFPAAPAPNLSKIQPVVTTCQFWQECGGVLHSPGGEIFPTVFLQSPRVVNSSPPFATMQAEKSAELNVAPSAQLSQCRSTDIKFGQTISQRLNPSDCSSDRFFDQYLLSGNAGELAEFTMRSEDFDVSLQIFGPDSQLLSSFMGGPVATLRTPLPTTGTYLIVATSAQPAQRGAYEISLKTFLTISGRVRFFEVDGTNNPLPGATITAVNFAGTYSTTAVSGADGSYVLYFPQMPDSYKVTASYPWGSNIILIDPLFAVFDPLTHDEILDFQFSRLQPTSTEGHVGVRAPSTAGLRVTVTSSNLAAPINCLLDRELLTSEITYFCPGLISGGTYTFTRTSDFFVFEPASMVISGPLSSVIGLDFPGPTYVINPSPTLVTIAPVSAIAGDSSLTLTVNGANFVTGSVVRFNGQDRSTTFVSSVQLNARLTTTDLQNGAINQISVFNPPFGGGGSSESVFVVNNPVPVISGLNETSTQAGSPAFEITVNGGSFVPGSIVRWNGQERATVFVSNTQIKAQITAADIGTAGQSSIAVFNPPPQGGASNTVGFTVTPVTVVGSTASVRTEPPGLAFEVDGISYTSPQSFPDWAPGSSHTISTTPIQGDGQTRRVFASWSDGGGITHTVTPSTNTTYVATFSTQHFLNMVANAGGTVGPQSNWFNAGESVSIAATPNGSFAFGGWNGNGPGSFTGISNPALVTITGPITQIASFTEATSRRTLYDFDGDGVADFAVRRPSENIWYFLRSTAGYTGFEYGIAGDLMTPADFDGDGRTDVAVFRPTEGKWYIAGSTTGFYTDNWGSSGDLPVAADYDGDGRADIAVFRPSDGTWYKKLSSGGISVVQFGVSGDKPVPGDYDGDGQADIAVTRSSNNVWYLLKTTTGYTEFPWGIPGDIQAPADYDGDGRTDITVFRPSTGAWFVVGSHAGLMTTSWGLSGDIPVPADWDGDGSADLAVFRPANATWYLLRSSAGILNTPFGVTGDEPVPSAFIY